MNSLKHSMEDDEDTESTAVETSATKKSTTKASAKKAAPAPKKAEAKKSSGKSLDDLLAQYAKISDKQTQIAKELRIAVRKAGGSVRDLNKKKAVKK